ncbi:MAG: hypothetical protein KF708_13680 [Pirellulales bacterium]|nr:hypothetical protein [Pirellulales bacterium]
MKRLWILGLSATAVLMMGSFVQAGTIIIDEFNANQSVVTGPGASPKSASGSLADAGILGGERDAVLSVLSGLGAQGAQAIVYDGIGTGKLYYSQDSSVVSNLVLTYDGTNGGAGFNPTGLGGYDLTGGGTEYGFELGLSYQDSPYTIELTVYDASNSQGLKWSRETITPGSVIFTDTAVVIPYGHFGDAPGEVGPAGPASFNNVGAVVMRIQSVNRGADIEVNYLKTSVVPEPASIVTAVLGAALCGFGYLRRRNRAK